jgi:hypothetical protein
MCFLCNNGDKYGIFIHLYSVPVFMEGNNVISDTASKPHKPGHGRKRV